ncbi:MAG: extracellular solute-binding protein [Candidatus Bathyarchaeia archaeon]
MNKKLVALAAIVIIIIASVAIYYATLPPPAPPPEEKPPPPPEKPKVKMEFWTGFGGEMPAKWFWDNVSAAFEKETGVQVEVVHITSAEYWTKLASAFAAGAPPDLFVTWGGGELKKYVEEGLVADISDLYREDWAKAQIPEAVAKSFTLNGKLWAIPYEVHSEWIFINRKLFKKVGVEIPSIEEGWTWEEFLDACKKFKAAGIVPVAMTGKSGWTLRFPMYYLVERLSGPEAFPKALEREISFADFHLKPFEVAQQWVKKGYFQKGWEGHAYMDGYRYFAEGEAAMWIQGTWVVAMLGEAEKAGTVELDVVPFPYFSERPEPEVRKAIFGSPTGFSIASASKNIDSAKEFLRFASKPEWLIKAARDWGTPVPQKVSIPEGTYHPVLKKCIDALATAPSFQLRYATLAYPREFATYVGDVYVEILIGTKTPEEGARAIEDKAVEFIGPLKA